MMKKPIICLAPLAGYTNVAYRNFMKKFGCDIVVSEMISDYALIYQNKETLKMVATCSSERPVAIQLFGGQKESIIQGLKELMKVSDYDYLDLNLGCPVMKVVKNNAGSSWLKNERQEELYDMVKAVVDLSNKPVNVKIRLGWDNNSINVVNTCKILEKAGINMITIHGRTRSQMYSGNADYECIKLAKENVKIPIIANGDINTLEKAIEVLNYTLADGIAIGRGCLGNPYLITQIKQFYDSGQVLPLPSITMQIDFLKEHYLELKKIKGEYVALQEIRGIAPWYLKGFTHTKDYRVRFTQVKEEKEFFDICEEIINNHDIERSNNKS